MSFEKHVLTIALFASLIFAIFESMVVGIVDIVDSPSASGKTAVIFGMLVQWMVYGFAIFVTFTRKVSID